MDTAGSHDHSESSSEDWTASSRPFAPWTPSYDDWLSEDPQRPDWTPDAVVGLRLALHGPDAAQARARLDAWFRTCYSLDFAPPGHGAGLGGAWAARFGVGTAQEPLIVELRSGGQDGIESLDGAAEEVHEVLSGLRLTGAFERLPLEWPLEG